MPEKEKSDIFERVVEGYIVPKQMLKKGKHALIGIYQKIIILLAKYVASV